MNTGKILVIAAFAGAVVALFTTEKGKKIREELADTAEDWSESLSDLLDQATCSVKDLQKLLSKEISGLTEDARERIMTIIEESMKSGKRMKEAIQSELA